MISIHINRLSSQLLKRISMKEEAIERLFEQLMIHSNLPSTSIDLQFVGIGEMRNYSSHYKGIDKCCDVLAFPNKENYLSDDVVSFLGSIVICIPFLLSRLVQKRWYCERAGKVKIHQLLVHSYCHLLGYDHLIRKDALLMRQKEIYFAQKTMKLFLQQ